MNTQQRITKLEQAISPAKDERRPMLVKFIGHSDEPTATAAILTVFKGKATSNHKLTTQELKDYEASNQPADVWINSLPRPRRAL